MPRRREYSSIILKISETIKELLHPFIKVFITPFIHQSIHPSLHSSIIPCIHHSIHPSFHASIISFIHHFIYPSFHLSVISISFIHPSMHQFICSLFILCMSYLMHSLFNFFFNFPVVFRLSGFQFLAIGLPPASPCSSEISPIVSVMFFPFSF